MLAVILVVIAIFNVGAPLLHVRSYVRERLGVLRVALYVVEGRLLELYSIVADAPDFIDQIVLVVFEPIFFSQDHMLCNDLMGLCKFQRLEKVWYLLQCCNRLLRKRETVLHQCFFGNKFH